MTQFYQVLPRVSTASDKHWGEKAWVRGYGTNPLALAFHLNTKLLVIIHTSMIDCHLYQCPVTPSATMTYPADHGHFCVQN